MFDWSVSQNLVYSNKYVWDTTQSKSTGFLQFCANVRKTSPRNAENVGWQRQVQHQRSPLQRQYPLYCSNQRATPRLTSSRLINLDCKRKKQDVKRNDTVRKEEAHRLLPLPYEHQAWTIAHFLIPKTVTVGIIYNGKSFHHHHKANNFWITQGNGCKPHPIYI